LTGFQGRQLVPPLHFVIMTFEHSKNTICSSLKIVMPVAIDDMNGTRSCTKKHARQLCEAPFRIEVAYI
jgi:hypothetical protein